MTRDPAQFLDNSFPLPIDRPFTRKAALAAGLTDRRLGALVASKHLRRPIEGVYVPAQLPDGLDLRAEVLLLVVPAGCFVCDETSAWLHGAPMAMAPNAHLDVPRVSFFRPADEGRLRNPLVASGERTLSEDDLMEVNGVLTTTPLRTALDLGRLRRRDHALAALDALLGLGSFTHDELLASMGRFARQRGVVQLRWLAPLADGRAESAGESALRLRWYDAGLPRPELQIPVVVDGKVIFRIDLGVEDLLFGAEYDGEEWHSSDEQVRADGERRAWLAEQRCWLIEVFLRAHVYGLRQDADRRLAAAFRQAQATRGARTFIV